MIGDLGEVVGEVVERAVAVGRRPADARAVDPDDPDVELFGEVPSGLRYLPPGARGAVQPHERAAVSRAELREAEPADAPPHRDGPLDPRGCDGLAGRSVLGGHVVSLRRVHDPAQRRRSRGRPIRRLHVAQRARPRRMMGTVPLRSAIGGAGSDPEALQRGAEVVVQPLARVRHGAPSTVDDRGIGLGPGGVHAPRPRSVERARRPRRTVRVGRCRPSQGDTPPRRQEVRSRW